MAADGPGALHDARAAVPAPHSDEMATFAAMLDRHRIPAVLGRQHGWRLVVAAFALVLCIGYNLNHPTPGDPSPAGIWAAIIVGVLQLGVCAAVLIVLTRRLRRAATSPLIGVRERALQITDAFQRWANTLLSLAVVSNAVVVIGTVFGLNLFSRSGMVLTLGELPTLVLFAHALLCWPTRAHLLASYNRVFVATAARA